MYQTIYTHQYELIRFEKKTAFQFTGCYAKDFYGLK